MILQPTPPPALQKRIGIITRDAALGSILGALLVEWNYQVLEAPTDGDLLLVQEGCLPPVENANVFWLTSSQYEGRNRLHLPVAIEELWRQLEPRYHKPPRNHIRLTLELPATVEVHGESIPARVISLSDLGARFKFPREMVNGEKLSLVTALGEEKLVLAGRVIYVVPRGDVEDSGRSEIGLILSDTPAETRTRVREFILWHYLATVRAKMEESLFADGLGFLDIPESVRRRLGSP